MTVVHNIKDVPSSGQTIQDRSYIADDLNRLWRMPKGIEGMNVGDNLSTMRINLDVIPSSSMVLTGDATKIPDGSHLIIKLRKGAVLNFDVHTFTQS